MASSEQICQNQLVLTLYAKPMRQNLDFAKAMTTKEPVVMICVETC